MQNSICFGKVIICRCRNKNHNDIHYKLDSIEDLSSEFYAKAEDEDISTINSEDGNELIIDAAE